MARAYLLVTMIPHPACHLFASAINLAVDSTFLAQIALFGVFVSLLKPLLFDPLLRVFAERERRTEGAKEARAMDDEAGELLRRYESELARVRREAGLERERLRGEATRLEAKIMLEAREETARILEAGKERSAAEIAELRRELEGHKAELAAQNRGADHRPGGDVVTRARTAALAMVAAVALAGSFALAQPVPRPTPGIPGLPPGHPQPGGRLPPGFQGRPPPGFQGRSPPGFPPGGRTGFPPGGRTPPGFPQPQRPAAHPVEAETHAGAHEQECPGHGRDDPPSQPNFWHGLLMVNNEAATKGGFVNQLLFRYENDKNPCDPRNEPAPFLASLINFGILAYILYRFGRKPLAESLLKRKQSIMGEIETAAKLKADAERRLDDYQDKIDHIEAKLAEVRAEYAAQAEIEKKQILTDAEERRVRMRRDAELRVEQEMKAARAQLLRDAVEAAVAAAEDLLTRQVTAADLDRMAGDYLKSVGPAISAAALGLGGGRS